MKMHRLFLLLACAACAPMPSPGWSIDRVNRELDGHDMNEFIVSYGTPAGSRAAENGDTIYRWVSIEPHGGGSGGGYIHYPGGHYVTPVSNSNGDLVSGYCEVSIRVSEDEKIKKITLVNDSTGKYSVSRCAEIFSQSPPK